MSFISINPSTGLEIARFEPISYVQSIDTITTAQEAFELWKKTTFSMRSKLINNLADLLRQRRHNLAQLITDEMGCPISQSLTEIEKCAYICSVFAEKSEEYLQAEHIQTGAQDSYVSFDPLGVLLHIAPWNYPFYLALRPAIPAIMAGNTVIMKHSRNVTLCSLAIDNLFKDAGFSKGVFTSIILDSKDVTNMIKDPRISLVTLIGSEKAGMSVASTAGSYLKKTVMELGGSDPFIVLEDADLEKAVRGAHTSRLRNCGQSCNAAKRFIVLRKNYEEFVSGLKELFEKEIIADPSDPETTLGPLATESSLAEIKRQILESLQMGAKIITGGEYDGSLNGYYYKPTILTHVTSQMPIWKEEVFGPVAPVIVADSTEEAIFLANQSSYGLGASIWTNDIELARSIIPLLESGNVYVNQIVRGDPRMPYGGIKRSGYGREFSEYGIKEFVNIKSVVIS